MAKKHALLSPSSAYRWLHCTTAPRLEADVPDESSDYAEEGTLAHAYCARMLKQYLGLPTEGEDQEIAELGPQYHSGEMDEYVAQYVDLVLYKYSEARQRTRDAKLLIETRLDFSEWVPDAFGTADAIIIADGEMEVIDFKYGKGVRVSADHNPQMMIYALGAWSAFSFAYDIQSVRMTIVQPRIDNVSECRLKVMTLAKWADEELKPKAEQAYKGDGPEVPGEWCRFCKVRGQCEALKEQCLSWAQNFSDPKLISNAEMAQRVLPALPTVKIWLAAVEEYALKQALAGEQYEGYKVVAGRSVRKITDPEGAMAALRSEGILDEAFLKPRELRTITELEKALGKKHFAELCGAYVTKPQGKPNLVPVTDKRPPYSTAAEDFKSF